MMPFLRQVLPRARVLGTVYVPAEVNMVAEMEVMRAAVSAAGLELRAVAANSAPEVQDAALALVTAGVDAICQIPGNLTAAAFPSIADVARRSHTPVFAYQTSQVRAGATLALARDYYENGHAAGQMAARVMRGESPASIPFAGLSGSKLVVNAAAAREIGVVIPAAILDKADEVIGQ
jgi:putative ABC transport system substrate-binding protein